MKAILRVPKPKNVILGTFNLNFGHFTKLPFGSFWGDLGWGRYKLYKLPIECNDPGDDDSILGGAFRLHAPLNKQQTLQTKYWLGCDSFVLGQRAMLVSGRVMEEIPPPVADIFTQTLYIHLMNVIFSEIPNNHLGSVKLVVSNGINYQAQGEQNFSHQQQKCFFTSPVLSHVLRL